MDDGGWGVEAQRDRAMAIPPAWILVVNHNGRAQPDPDHDFVGSSFLRPKQWGLGAERCSRSRQNSLSIYSPTAHIGESRLERGEAVSLATRRSFQNQRRDGQDRLTRWVTFAPRDMGITKFDRIPG